jgi:hypothetical protein
LMEDRNRRTRKTATTMAKKTRFFFMTFFMTILRLRDEMEGPWKKPMEDAHTGRTRQDLPRRRTRVHADHD